MQPTIKSVVCPVRYCGRLVSAALPLPARSSHHFDTRTYCSQRCVELHSCDGERAPPGPLITCDVCADDKPLNDYIYTIKEPGADTGQWNIPVPSGCLSHIAPELQNLERGVCTDCLRSHILTQFQTRGAINVSCIEHCLTLTRTSSTRLSKYWVPYAPHFLPPDKCDTFNQHLFDHCIRTTGASLWTCPSNCGYSNGILQSNNTPGFPHVECPGCSDRFCANCKVPWHMHQTCQQYRTAHPEVRDKDEDKQLREMARLGARLCPRCQFIIIKDGGCDHVFCEQCHFDFDWPQAQKVVAPIETFEPTFVPGPTTGASASTFRGWSQLKQVQEEYTERNKIAGASIDIGNTNGRSKDVQLDDRIFFYNRDTYFWSPEICELDAIAGQEAGKRFIRQPSHDEGRLWAFIEVDRQHVGGVDLNEALNAGRQQMETWGDTERILGVDAYGHLVVQRGRVNDPSPEILARPCDSEKSLRRQRRR